MLAFRTGLRTGLCSRQLPLALPLIRRAQATPIRANFCSLGHKPTLEDAKKMPRSYYEMPNDVLVRRSRWVSRPSNIARTCPEWPINLFLAAL